MTFRFLHTSDLHLGKPFGGYPDALRHRLREARHGVLHRLADAARAQAAAHVLVAGDTFDAETPSPETLRQALRAMADASDLTWVLLPGNHDSLAATELWRRVAADGPGNVAVVASEAPVALVPGVWLLPAPCTQRRPGRDLTEAMAAPTPDGALRIGLGHGAITDFAGAGFAGEEGSPGVIPPDRAARSGLDYLGLGDWHGQMRVGPATWYAGTPEPDAFKHDAPGAALVVTLAAPGAPPQVVPVVTGQFRWLDLRLDLLPGEDAPARLAAALPTARQRDHLVRLRVTGRLALEPRAALDAAVDRVAPEFGFLAADLSGLGIDARPDDLDRIDRGGALRQAAEVLLAESRDPTLGTEGRAVAAAALARLYGFATDAAGEAGG
jgi:hypothetical protein